MRTSSSDRAAPDKARIAPSQNDAYDKEALAALERSGALSQIDGLVERLDLIGRDMGAG